MGLFLAAFSGVLALINGIACSLGSEDRKQILVFNFLAPFFTMSLALMFRVDWSVVASLGIINPGPTFFILLISGFCGLGYVMMLMYAMNSGPHALSICLGESCLVIPYLVSTLIWKDKAGVVGITGLLLIIAAIFVIGLTKDKSTNESESKITLSNRWVIFMASAFLLGGLELTLYTIPNRWPGWSDTANLRPALIQLGRLVMIIPILIKKIKPTKKTTVISLTAAVFNFILLAVQFAAMDYLAKDGMIAVLYPVSIGMYILLFTAYGVLYRKEKLPPAAYTGMAAILAGIILLGF